MSSFHLTTHFFNEEMLMPYFVKHHAPIFDSVTAINHRSTDKSVEIIRELAPHWKVVNTTMVDFTAALLEPEVHFWEDQAKADFKLVLNTTEFVFDPDFREHVICLMNYPGADKSPRALGLGSYIMVDKEELPLDDKPLWKTRTWGYKDPGHVRRKRYLHNTTNGQYHLGRHGTNLPSFNVEAVSLQWFGWSPYPQCRERKLQIQTQIGSDRINNLGWEHIQTEESLTNFYMSHLEHSKNLLECYEYKVIYENYLNGNSSEKDTRS